MRPPVLLAIAALALAGCASSGTTAAAPPPSSTAPAPEPSASVSVSVSTEDPWQDWCFGGNGYTDLQAVTADISQIRVDIDNGQMGTATQDGQKLTEDAQAAKSDLPPESSAARIQYKRYMTQAALAGTQFYNDDVAAALPHIERAGKLKAAVQQAANKCQAE